MLTYEQAECNVYFVRIYFPKF